MQVVERLADLQGNIDRFGLAEPAPSRRQSCLERLTSDVIHHEIMMILFTEAVGDFWNSGVVKLGENVSFALKAEHCVAARIVAGEAIDHNRECAAPRLEVQILGQVNGLHPPFTEWLNDSITIGDHGPWRYDPHLRLYIFIAVTDQLRMLSRG